MGLTRDIVTKAVKEADFREALQADPRAAIQKAFGVELPGDVDVVVHQDSANVINLVLPMPLKNPRRTLGPIELEDVAGRPGGGIMFATAPCTDTRCFTSGPL